jgi:hypothetical protein
MRIELAKSARMHKVGRTRVLYVIENPFVEAVVPGCAGQDDRLVFLGDDVTGRALEVMAVQTQTGLLVIHAMDLRPKWRTLYEEGRP